MVLPTAMFDAVTVKYALDEDRHYDKPSGNAPFKFQMVWSLNGDDDKKTAAPKGAKQ